MQLEFVLSFMFFFFFFHSESPHRFRESPAAAFASLCGGGDPSVCMVSPGDKDG